ncbi:MAG: GGDEF domain-containing protein [Bacilli bacterium]|jgi:diguanylate cyclase (GGDEF)-like protein
MNIQKNSNSKERVKNINVVSDKFFKDFSTTLYNKNYFIKNMNDIATKMIKGLSINSKSNDLDKTWSIMFCDIDGLKLINDTFGHVKADAGIKHIAYVIKKCIKNNKCKNINNNIPIRFGGDEFIIIFPNCTKEKASIIENRIKKQIGKDQKQTFNMTLSIGIADTNEIKAPLNADCEDNNVVFINDLISLAEERMYTDKGKDVKSLSYEEKKVFISRYLNRIGFDINTTEEIDMLINILNDKKKQLEDMKKE